MVIKGFLQQPLKMHVRASMGNLDTAMEAFDKSANKGSPRAPSPTLSDKNRYVISHPKDCSMQACICSMPTIEDVDW